MAGATERDLRPMRLKRGTSFQLLFGVCCWGRGLYSPLGYFAPTVIVYIPV